ncbi:hypothetical protein ACN469_12930 [Corallococcus terminator]
MATPDVVLFRVSPSVTDGMAGDTLRALAQVCSSTGPKGPRVDVFEPPALPERVLTPRRAAMLTVSERVPAREAVGRISAETMGCFPPGQAVFVAGERVTEEGIVYLERAVATGAHLKRVQDDHFRTLCVIREGPPWHVNGHTASVKSWLLSKPVVRPPQPLSPVP